MLLFLSLGEAGVCFLLLIFHFLGKKTKPKSCIFKVIHHLKYLCISCHKKLLAWGQAQWLMTIIPATWEVEAKRITVRGQTRQKVSKTPSQPIAGCGGVYLSSQLCRKHK
jgi:hypothetical protein